MPGTTNLTPADGYNPTSANPLTSPYVGTVDSGAIRRGHESDTYDLKSVLSVPLLVILFFVLAFTTVTIVFGFISHSEVDPNANPFAVKQNEAPLNERLNRIHRGGAVDQPRLEPLRLRTGDEQAISRPETATGNSPEIHPEDIRPNRENTPELYKVGWIDPNKTAARITIDEAMKLALQQKGLFPTNKNGTKPPITSNVPSAANAGRGSDALIALPPKLPGAVEEKK